MNGQIKARRMQLRGNRRAHSPGRARDHRKLWGIHNAIVDLFRPVAALYGAAVSNSHTHSELLPRHIAAALRDSGGWLRFDRYMELALYHPRQGYYASGRARIGACGDFDTAAETSALFGRALAGQCSEILAACNGADIAELGPGSGRLAEVLLGELKRSRHLPRRYILVEPAMGMRDAQRERLRKVHPDLAGRLQFTDTLAGERIRGVILANEVIDALPCRCFKRTASGWRERGAVLAEGRLRWEDRPADAAFLATLENLEAELPASLPEGYCSEIRVNLDGFMRELAAALESGVALLADYGLPRHELYLNERSSGTLGCHSGQRWHDDPFRQPGREDIGAWVDFTELKRSAEAAGLRAVGFTTQAQFLLAAGILGLAGSPPAPEDAAALRRLMLPGGMGEAFKFLGLAPKTNASPAVPSGFGGRDRLASLDACHTEAGVSEAARA